MKKVMDYIGRQITGTAVGLRIFWNGSYKDTAAGSIVVSALVTALLAAGSLNSSLLLAFSLWICVLPAVPVVLLAGELLTLVFRLLFGTRRRSLAYWLLQYTALFLCLSAAPSNTGIFANLLCTVVQSCVGCLFGRSFWAFLRHRRFSLCNLTCGFISLIEIVIVSLFFFGPGFRSNPFDSYLSLTDDIPLPAQKTLDTTFGPHEVCSVTYGVDAGYELSAPTVDISGLAGENDLKAWNRKKAVGHTISEAPVQGCIWYPKDGEKCPLVMIVHGNHTYTDASFRGYEYLGSYLASHGYVVVSVDENVCNLLGNENDARGALLFENIWFLKNTLSTVQPELHQMIDFANIALAGHSRGGEAITSAWLYNRIRTNPDNGFYTFHPNTVPFHIKSLIAIAPTVDQYEPAGHAVQLQDVNYLLIHGSNDQDVTRVMGNKQYNNISWSSADGDHRYLKSMLYVGGANHGQFNTEWGLYDSEFPVRNQLNVGNLLPAEDQRTILKLFMKTFLDVTLKGDDTNRDLLYDYRVYAECLPETVYQQCYATSERTVIADFEEDVNPTTATIAGGSIRATNLYSWWEQKWWYGTSGECENHLLHLESGETAAGRVTVTMPAMNVTDKTLVFDLADGRENAESKPSLLHMGITVMDSVNRSARFDLQDVATVYPTLWVQLTKLDYLWNSRQCRHQMQTVSIPFSAFAAKNSDLDLTAIAKVVFTIQPEQGAVYLIDNVAVDD